MQTFPHVDVFYVEQPDEAIFIFEELSFHLENFHSSILLKILCQYETLFQSEMIIILAVC